MPRYLISRQISDILCLKFFILPIKPLFYIFHQPKYFSSSNFRNFDRSKKIKIDGLISQLFFSVFSSFWLLNTTFLCFLRKVSKWALIYAQKQQKWWNYIKNVIFRILSAIKWTNWVVSKMQVLVGENAVKVLCALLEVVTFNFWTKRSFFELSFSLRE